jgi:hypothetical protein
MGTRARACINKEGGHDRPDTILCWICNSAFASIFTGTAIDLNRRAIIDNLTLDDDIGYIAIPESTMPTMVGMGLVGIGLARQKRR